MAIIQCPECNKSISDTLSQCIHCGYEFKICSDCKSVIGLNQSICPICGFKTSEKIDAFNQDKSVEDNQKLDTQTRDSFDENTPSYESAFSSCKAVYPLGKLMQKKVLNVMTCISGVLIFLLIVVFAITNPNNFNINLNIIGVLAVVSGLISISTNYFEALWNLGYYKMFNKYLSDNSISGISIIEKELSSGFLQLNNKEKRRLKVNLNRLIDSQLYKTNSSVKLINSILSLTLSTLLSLTEILFVAFVLTNISFLKEQFIIYGSELPLIFKNIGLFIFAILFGFSLVIVKVICDFNMNKKVRKDWVKNKIPHRLKDYETLEQILKI